MECRYQNIATALIGATLLAGGYSSHAQEPLAFEVRHDHLIKSGRGTLLIEPARIYYRESGAPKEPGKGKHVWEWPFEEIQELRLSPRTLSFVTYEDDKWMAGRDRRYSFSLAGDATFHSAYGLLKNRLDSRFVAIFADESVTPLWEIPVKHLTRFGGHQGKLIIGEDRVVFSTSAKGESRTWRNEDIENISSSGPHQLTLTTYERALGHYGNLKQFNFQLKQQMDQERYDWLWQMIHRPPALEVLTPLPTLTTRKESRNERNMTE